MSKSQTHYRHGNDVKDVATQKTVAVAVYEGGAEIISKALNFYFGDTYTRNEAVEMMHTNTANALTSIAALLEKYEYTGEMAVEYLKELAEEMAAQAQVVALRDELKIDKPKP